MLPIEEDVGGSVYESGVGGNPRERKESFPQRWDIQ